MSLTSPPRSARTPLTQVPVTQAPLSRSAQRPASRAAKGYRVIRPTRPEAAARGAGLLVRLWQRLCAALRVTPQQWYARQLARQTDQDVGQRVVLLSGGQLVLMRPQVPATSGRRPAQPDLT